MSVMVKLRTSIASVHAFLLILVVLNQAKWLNTNAGGVWEVTRESHCPSAKQSQGQKKIVCERTDREESVRVCEFTVCVRQRERAGERKGGGDKGRNGYKREGGDEGMVRKKDERWQAIKRPINLGNECPSSRGYCSLLHVHQSQV